jgi:hypothetical protein
MMLNMKNAVFWVWHYVGVLVTANVPSLLIHPAQKMEVTRSYETSLLSSPTQSHIPEDMILSILVEAQIHIIEQTL